MVKTSKMRQNKKQKNEPAISSKGTAKLLRKVKNGRVLGKSDRSASSKSPSFIPRKMIKRGNAAVADNPVLEANAVNRDLRDEELNGDVEILDRWPDVVLLAIFSHLTQNELGQVAQVCRRWNRLVKSKSLWKKVDVELYNSSGSQDIAFKNFVGNLSPLTTHVRLDFRVCSDWAGCLDFKDLCSSLCHQCPELQMLFLHSSKLSIGIQEIVDLCIAFLQKLKTLVIRNTVFSLEKRIVSDHFILDYNNDKSACKIETLDLINCELEYRPFVPSAKMPCLKVLRLGCSKRLFTKKDNGIFYRLGYSFRLKEILDHKSLEILDIGSTPIPIQFSALLKLTDRPYAPSLKELYVCDSRSLIDNDDIQNIPSIFPHLEKVCLFGCLNVQCEGVISMLKSCSHLQVVYVDRNLHQTCVKHPYFLENKYMLERLKVFRCAWHRKINYFCD